MTFDAVDGCIVQFGGAGNLGVTFGQTWIYNQVKPCGLRGWSPSGVGRTKGAVGRFSRSHPSRWRTRGCAMGQTFASSGGRMGWDRRASLGSAGTQPRMTNFAIVVEFPTV
jgi:hypothetical protein